MNTVSVDKVDYELIADQNDGGGEYEWGYAALVRGPDGQLYVVRDGGCSCNGPWEYAGSSDFERVPSWQEAIERLKADRPGFFTDDDVAAFAQKLMELRPAPSPS